MSEKQKKSRQEQIEEHKKKMALQKKSELRITIARQGREAFLKKDYATAIRKYNEYLGTLAQLNAIEDIFQLKPSMFDPKKDVTEMLLISHIYWEIARMYEHSPKLQKNYQRAINQFVAFTANQKYQVLNAEMIRKYIKKYKSSSPHIGSLEKAYSQIFVQSKKCFIATHVFGSEDDITNQLRLFKSDMLQKKFGIYWINVYYKLSSPLVDLCEKYRLLSGILKLLARPVLRIFAKLYTKSKII